MQKYGLWAVTALLLLAACAFMYVDLREARKENHDLQLQQLYWMQSTNFTLNQMLEEQKKAFTMTPYRQN